MGSSNATHVRLLNATLESEGLYACEISTQNLSTIRSEREIRVYGKCNERASERETFNELYFLRLFIAPLRVLSVTGHFRLIRTPEEQ